MEAERIRVVVIEDHDELRAALVDALEELGPMDVVAQSGRMIGALELLVRVAPDVAVLDAGMADGNGVDLCRAARTAVPDTKCVVVSACERQGVRRAAFDAGAVGFVDKTTHITTVVDEIRYAVADTSGAGAPD